MPARLAQEELERVRRRLRRSRDRLRGGLRLGLVLEHLDSARLELTEHGVHLGRVELVRVDHVREVGVADAPRDLRALEDDLEVLALQEAFEVDARVCSLALQFRTLRPAAASGVQG
jgi:hypothetical protein